MEGIKLNSFVCICVRKVIQAKLLPFMLYAFFNEDKTERKCL